MGFTVPSGRADLRFLTLQPGSGVGVWGQAILDFTHPSYSRSPFFSRYPFRTGSTLAELTKSHQQYLNRVVKSVPLYSLLFYLLWYCMFVFGFLALLYTSKFIYFRPKERMGFLWKSTSCYSRWMVQKVFGYYNSPDPIAPRWSCHLCYRSKAKGRFEHAFSGAFFTLKFYSC